MIDDLFKESSMRFRENLTDSLFAVIYWGVEMGGGGGSHISKTSMRMGGRAEISSGSQICTYSTSIDE